MNNGRNVKLADLGITFIDKIFDKDDVALVPWLVGEEWKKISNINSKV